MIFAALHVAGLAIVAALPDPLARFPLYAVGVFIATVSWIALALRLLRESAAPSRGLVVAGVVAALAGRLLLLVPPTPLSDDLHRYLWDGRVANAGINPFLHAPDSPALDFLRNETVARVNHPEIPTIYPPVAQMYFRALDRLGAGALGVRATATAFDLAAAILLAGVLRRFGRHPALALIHACCPLAILESAGGGHVDAFGVLLLAGALAAAPSTASWPRAFLAGALLGGAALVKLVPIALVPSFVVRRPASAAAALLAGVAIAGAAFLPYVDPGARIFDGLAAYARHWHFHDLFYSFGVEAGLDPFDVRRLLAGAFAFLACAAPFVVRDRAACAGVVFGAFLMLSPTVHPWYALWLAPFLPFLPRALRPAAFALVALLPFAYVSTWLAKGTGSWQEPSWSRAILWIPVTVLLAAGLLRSWSGSRALNRPADSTDGSLRARS